jgi:tRNA(Ile)-lysidine synthase
MGQTSLLVGRVGRFLSALPGAGLVVAVSGGPDSVALARAVAEARGPAAAGPLVLAHLNHMLRGADSDSDADFVAGLHAGLKAAGVADVRLCVERLDVAGMARREKDNLEALARRERYRFLAEVARREGVGLVATAHTADDQAETVLHRLLRGSGLQGLRGIAARRTLAEGVELVRPLLTSTRAEILGYLHEVQQGFRQDQSNQDRRRTRNRIRHELLPLLRRDYNPAVAAALARLAAQAQETFTLEEEQARQLLQQVEKPRAGALCVLAWAPLAAAGRHQTRAALRLLWAREGWPLDAMSFDAWERLAGVVLGEAAACDLPGGVRARRRGQVLQLGREEAGGGA